MDSSPPPGRPTRGALRNADTQLPGVARQRSELHARSVSLEEAYRVAVGASRESPAAAGVGYRLFWLRADGACGCLEARAERGKHVVVGRHDRCDLVLDDERSVSLRHLLLRVSALHDGFPVLNVLDLETTAGFELSDGSKQRCVVATGPLVFRVGVHALVALPNGVQVEPDLPPPVVDRAEADPYSVRAERIELEPAPPRRITRITLLPASVKLGESAMHEDRAAVGDARASNADRYEAWLEAAGRRAAVRLSARDVEHGVLIGRNEKCLDAGLRALLHDCVSRVHALVIREKDGVFLYDTASTCGVVAHGARTRCVALSDDGTEVRLAGDHGALLRWRSVPSPGP